MIKLLVSTDFSENSLAGLLFANQLASQTPVTITFAHVLHLIRPTSWGDASFEEHKEEEGAKALEELKKFVIDACISKHLGAIDFAQSEYVILHNAHAEKALREYAQAQAMHYICVGTSGRGGLKRIAGSNTAALIKHSETPVISVPAHYAPAPLQHILYASDLKALEGELQQVVDFAKPLGAKVELLHFNSLAESLESEQVQETVQKFSDYQVSVHVENPDYVKSLVAHIKDALHTSQASMLVMFTEQNRTFFQKLFVSSKAADYTFDAPVPLLTFKK